MPQTYTCLHYHLIFSTKHRLPQITSDIRQRLYDYIGGIYRSEGGILSAAGGMEDHIHLLGDIPARTAVSKFLQVMKSSSSGWVHDTFPANQEFAWQEGYGAFSVSHSNRSQVHEYIANQEEHHRRMTFKEEFIEFLERHEVPYDKRYVWE